MSLLDAAWRLRAACRGKDPAIFFPERGEDLEPAKAICRECPVKAPCGQYALSYENQGVWGGMGGRERKMERARLGIKREVPLHIESMRSRSSYRGPRARAS